MLADQTTLINGGTITVGNGTGRLTGDAGRQVIQNSGTITTMGHVIQIVLLLKRGVHRMCTR